MRGFAYYRRFLADRKFVTSALFGAVLLLVALTLNFYAAVYAKEEASNSVTDLILSNTRVFDFHFVFIWGSVIFWIIVVGLCLTRPQRIPFLLKSIALFILTRALFVSLTHIGPFPTQASIDYTRFIGKFTTGGDLFFSGHTGLPFLLALIFWREDALRFFFLASSVVFGIVVLLSHLHYTIDVLAAFFITYSIFHICEFFFPEDRRLFFDGIEMRRE